MNLVSTKGALLKSAHKKAELPYPCHPVIPDTEWTKKRWGLMMEIAMEKWKAPGVSIRLIEEGKAEGTYEVTTEKKKDSNRK